MIKLIILIIFVTLKNWKKFFYENLIFLKNDKFLTIFSFWSIFNFLKKFWKLEIAVLIEEFQIFRQILTLFFFCRLSDTGVSTCHQPHCRYHSANTNWWTGDWKSWRFGFWIFWFWSDCGRGRRRIRRVSSPWKSLHPSGHYRQNDETCRGFGTNPEIQKTWRRAGVKNNWIELTLYKLRDE